MTRKQRCRARRESHRTCVSSQHAPCCASGQLVSWKEGATAGLDTAQLVLLASPERPGERQVPSITQSALA